MAEDCRFVESCISFESLPRCSTAIGGGVPLCEYIASLERAVRARCHEPLHFLEAVHFLRTPFGSPIECNVALYPLCIATKVNCEAPVFSRYAVFCCADEETSLGFSIHFRYTGRASPPLISMNSVQQTMVGSDRPIRVRIATPPLSADPELGFDVVALQDAVTTCVERRFKDFLRVAGL